MFGDRGRDLEVEEEDESSCKESELTEDREGSLELLDVTCTSCHDTTSTRKITTAGKQQQLPVIQTTNRKTLHAHTTYAQTHTLLGSWIHSLHLT